MRRERAEQNRTVAQVEEDIARCNWVRRHVAGLRDAVNQDSVLKRLMNERDELIAEEMRS